MLAVSNILIRPTEGADGGESFDGVEEMSTLQC